MPVIDRHIVPDYVMTCQYNAFYFKRLAAIASVSGFYVAVFKTTALNRLAPDFSNPRVHRGCESRISCFAITT
jgi:hypothetical protein